MRTEAAILIELGRPLEVVELGVPALKPGQVLVELAYSGVCHTQVLEARGYRGEDRFLPHCLGHEGSGTVREVGAGVTKVKLDDGVVVSWIQGAGQQVPGATYDWNGRVVNAGAVTTFQRHAVVSENRLVKLPAGASMRDGALLGCAVPTGAGAVLNTVEAKAGNSLAVFGVGGVGLCAIMAAVAAGCTPIIAVDLVPAKLELARKLGATHAIDAAAGDPVAELRKLVPGGLDYAIEASGAPQAMEQALAAVRVRGGRAAVIGNARFGQRLSFDPMTLIGRQLTGSWGGETDPDRDLPRYGRLIAAGQLDLATLVGRSYPLGDINAALDDLEAGRVARPLIALSA